MTTLAMFLGRGGSVVGLDRWECLVDIAVGALTAPLPNRHRAAGVSRKCAKVVADDELLARFFRWEVEMYDDPAVAARLIDSLPEPQRSQAFADVAEVERLVGEVSASP